MKKANNAKTGAKAASAADDMAMSNTLFMKSANSSVGMVVKVRSGTLSISSMCIRAIMCGKMSRTMRVFIPSSSRRSMVSSRPLSLS